MLMIFTLTSCEDALVGDEKLLYARSQSFQSNPSEDRLRELLNTRTDGAFSYLKMALVGEAFGKHPEQFKNIVKNLHSKQEQNAILKLKELGADVFEYYPDRKPDSFDTVFKQATWLYTIKLDQNQSQNQNL